MRARIALASLDGYTDGGDDIEPEPFGGYCFRVPAGQGEAAPGGAYGYLVNGNMIGGHALLAIPSKYEDTGSHSFMAGENGIVYETDLGEETLEIAEGMALYDPGARWSVFED